MLNTLCLAVSLMSPPATGAGDYFPLVTGTKWTYREDSAFNPGDYVDEVKEPVEIGGQKCFPVETSLNKKLLETVYYSEAADTIFIVAYDPKKPLEAPRPLFKAGASKTKWEYTGLTPFMGQPIPIRVKGESTPRGIRKVLDREAECLEVRLEAQLGTDKEKFLVSKQTAIYAKGIGLVEMQEKATVARNTEERKLRLVEFTPGRP